MYVLALLGLGLLGLAVWAASLSLTATVNGGTVVCGSVLDHPDLVRLLTLDAFLSQREGCELALAKAHLLALATCAAGLLTFAVAAVRLANARRTPQ